MRIGPSILAALPALAALAGCRDKGVLPGGLAGSFVPQDTLLPAIRTHLNITPTGLTVTRYGAGASASVAINGQPVVKGSAEAGTGGAALFAKLRCESELSCTFTTRTGCEGSITGDGKGNVVLIAEGECSLWSGKWMAERDEAPRPSGSPAVSCPPPPPCPAAPAPSAPPSAAPVPSTPPSASAAPKDQLTCMSDCNHAHVACIKECKIGDTACVQRCAEGTSACIGRCH
jgi:hypothetical protein